MAMRQRTRTSDRQSNPTSLYWILAGLFTKEHSRKRPCLRGEWRVDKQSKFLGFWAVIRDETHGKPNVKKHLLNGYGGALKGRFGEGVMLERRADTAVLGLVSILYSIAVFFLKQRRA